MKVEHAKRAKVAHPQVFRGTASAPFVPAQGLGPQGNSLSLHPRPLPTAVPAQTTGNFTTTWNQLQRSPAAPPLRKECQQHYIQVSLCSDSRQPLS